MQASQWTLVVAFCYKHACLVTSRFQASGEHSYMRRSAICTAIDRRINIVSYLLYLITCTYTRDHSAKGIPPFEITFEIYGIQVCVFNCLLKCLTRIILEAQNEAESIWLGLCLEFRPPQWTSQSISASEDMSNKRREAAKRRGKKPRPA